MKIILFVFIIGFIFVNAKMDHIAFGELDIEVLEEEWKKNMTEYFESNVFDHRPTRPRENDYISEEA